MAALTLWPTLANTLGSVIDEEWEEFFDRCDAAGRCPFRGDMNQPGWSPTRVDPPIRADENVLALSALVLDYDGGYTIGEAEQMWDRFYAYIHTTRRHEPSAHRFRVILPFSREVTPEEYALLWHFVVQTAGHKVDQKTRNPSRFWYVPCSNGGIFHSVRLRGAVLDPDLMLPDARAAAERPTSAVVMRLHAGAETRADKYAQAALEDACKQVEGAAPGTRNNVLFIAASTAGNFIGAGNLAEGYAVERLEAAARTAGLPQFEALRTVRSGLLRGKQSPRQMPESERPSTWSEAPGVGVESREGTARESAAEPVTPPHPLHELWKSVGEWGLLDAPPPPQEWILMRPDVETNGMGNPIGLLPRSEVGFLIAAGGVGKSFACIQLALAVATGRKWLDYFIVPKTGRVLLLLGEEKLKQAHRRFHDLASSMRLTDEQVRLAKENIVMLPLAGVIAPLVTQDGTSTAETDVMAFLRARMAESEWTLVIIDPLSRFAGADTEKDNVQATRFVQVAETLCKVPGAPTVLFAHHTNKASRADDAPRPSAADARGASGTTDGGRWCANLMRKKGGASLSFTKNNYGQDYDETLVLERAYGGYLRVQPDETRLRLAAEEQAQEDARTAALRRRIRDALTKAPGLTKADLTPRVKARDADVRRAVDDMKRDGELIEQPRNHYHVKGASHA